MSGSMPARRPAVGVLGLVLAAVLGCIAVSGALEPRHAAAGSPFAWRGVIQGQYGQQFNAAQRRRLLRFMSRNGFNAYVHAPKGDPYQRTLWRDPYPPARQAALDAEVRLALRLGIQWIPNVSPAAPAFSSPGDDPPPGTSPSAPICFSSEADLQQLLAKLEPFYRAGSRTFMVSFDDVRRRFSCSADFAAYGKGAHGFGLATADLLDRLYARLLDRDRSARLLTVAADYAGTADTPYLSGFRQRLAPGIDVMWTGPTTESRPFGPADADAFAGLIGRAPVVWENWTVNDLLTQPGELPDRVFLGPYARGPRLVGHVNGFFFNPANQADLNFLPLATAGDWMRRPARYRPRRAFLRETRRLGGGQAPALRAFAEASYSSTLRGSVEAPTLRRLMHRFLRVRGKQGRARKAAARLRHQLRLATGARLHLSSVGGLRHLVREARPFLRSVRLNARAALLATDLLQAPRAAQRRQLRRRLRRALRRAAGWPAETYGSRVGVYGLAGNVIDGYVDRVRRLDRRRHAHGPRRGRRPNHQHQRMR
jgi:hyaluronoglucosaminidase